MTTMKFKRFTKPHVLRRIARELLITFFDRFERELAGHGLVLPDARLDDDTYCRALAGWLMAPEGLPDRLNEVLFALDEMATEEGQERLERAVAQAGLPLDCPPSTSAEDFALRVWLVSPELLARAHNEQRMLRLSAFEHFGVRPGIQPPVQPVTPDPGQLPALASALDGWFARHRRGQETTRIELHPLWDEFWFLVRHGGTFTRASTVEGSKSDVLYFRPERDDVIVYSPEAEELRINARTRGERELYRAELSRFLRGNDQHFSGRWTYTLEPLRQEGEDALSADGIDGLDRVVLRELEVAWENYQNEVTIRVADDLFHSTSPEGSGPIPRGGRLRRAVFDFQFRDSSKPRSVEIRLPNVLKLGRHCDLRAVHGWTRRNSFRLTPLPRPNAGHFLSR